jgi:hypothetical protein
MQGPCNCCSKQDSILRFAAPSALDRCAMKDSGRHLQTTRAERVDGNGTNHRHNLRHARHVIRKRKAASHSQNWPLIFGYSLFDIRCVLGLVFSNKYLLIVATYELVGASNPSIVFDRKNYPEAPGGGSARGSNCAWRPLRGTSARRSAGKRRLERNSGSCYVNDDVGLLISAGTVAFESRLKSAFLGYRTACYTWARRRTGARRRVRDDRGRP